MNDLRYRFGGNIPAQSEHEENWTVMSLDFHNLPLVEVGLAVVLRYQSFAFYPRWHDDHDRHLRQVNTLHSSRTLQ